MHMCLNTHLPDLHGHPDIGQSQDPSGGNRVEVCHQDRLQHAERRGEAQGLLSLLAKEEEGEIKLHNTHPQAYTQTQTYNLCLPQPSDFASLENKSRGAADDR